MNINNDIELNEYQSESQDKKINQNQNHLHYHNNNNNHNHNPNNIRSNNIPRVMNPYSPEYANYIGLKPKATASARIKLGGVY